MEPGFGNRRVLRRFSLAARQGRIAMRFQFSIRWIFAATAIVGLGLAALSAESGWISGGVIQLIFLVMPGLVATLLVAGRGYARFFAMGAVVPTLIGVAILVWFLIVGGTEAV